MTGSIKDYTPNFNFIIPEFNISGWHDYLEENFRSIDALFYNIFDIQEYVGKWKRLTNYTTNQVVFIDDATSSAYLGKLYKVLQNHTTTNVPFDEFYEEYPEYYERFLDASSAQQYANYCRIYAEGTDEEAAGLGITHSCKNWEQLCVGIYNDVYNIQQDIIGRHYAKDLSLNINTLQLLDEDNNPIGTPQTLNIGNGTIVIKQNNETMGSFTTNQSGNTEINLRNSNINVDAAISSSSENPVQNKVIYNALNNLHWTHKSDNAQIYDYEWVLETDTSSQYYYENYPYYKGIELPTSTITGDDVYNTFVNIAFSCKDAASGKLAPFIDIFPVTNPDDELVMVIQLYASEPITTENFEIQLHYAGSLYNV